MSLAASGVPGVRDPHPTYNRVVPAYSLLEPSVLMFVLLPIGIAAAFIWGSAVAFRRTGAAADAPRAARAAAIAAAMWMTATWLVAETGILRQWDRTPPPVAVMVIAIVAAACLIAFSPFGRRLALGVPLWALVGLQAFRLPLELAMHRMSERGIMPVQMSYSGLNFDIVTGITAAVLAPLLATGHAGRRAAALWNLLGIALLVNVVTVALLATPRIRYFGDESLNVWVTYPPFVWLPTVLVLGALAGHLLIARALALTRGASHGLTPG